MTLLHALILGIIEGVTEFLPISSTGHLILGSALLGIPQTDFVKTFEIAIQLGAILAVFGAYGKILWGRKDLILLLLVAFFPTGVLGFVLYPFVKALLGSDLVVAWSLVLGGIFLIFFERWQKDRMITFRTIETLEGKDALLIGLAQSVSMIPGVSRAGATILGGLSLGLDRRSAVLFSFLLALPTMAAATGYDLLKHASAFTNTDLFVLAIGFCAAFISAWIVVRWFLRYAEQHSFVPFGIYRIALGTLWILFSLYH